MTNTIKVREFQELKFDENVENSSQKDNMEVILSQGDFDFLKDIDKVETYNFFEQYYKDKQQNPPKIISWVDDKTLKIQNYVGMIKLPCGETLEILPKVQITSDTDNEKQKLIDMIVTTISPRISKDTQAKKTNTMMDYIIQWFLYHMDDVMKKGIKQDYVLRQENSLFVKGKILFNEHIKHNSVLQHRTFIEYEDYTADCIENRLLHSALLACVRHSQDNRIKQKAVRYCHYFDSIGEMTSLNDFKQWTSNRYYQHYSDIRPLAEIILSGVQPFMTQGKQNIPAILFPMEVVYEKYIAQCLENAGYNIQIQPNSKQLTDQGFNLQPDIVMEKDDQVIVLDTKWKKYQTNEYNTKGVSQSDAYQMFAYSQAYKADVILLYPKNHSPDTKDKQADEVNYTYSHGHQKKLITHLTDLDKEPNSIAEEIINNYFTTLAKQTA